MKTGRIEEAKANLTQMVKIEPRNAEGYNIRAAIYYRLKQFDQAWEDLNRCTQLGGTPHAELVKALSEAMSVK